MGLAAFDPERSQLLGKVGFIKDSFLGLYDFDEKTKTYAPRSGKLDFGHLDEEVFEQIAGDWVTTGYPKPVKRMRLIYEVYDLSIEETYFWVLKFLRHDSGFLKIDKLEDAFAAAEGSAFFGVMQQRIGIQQDKISQFLATIGKMVKEMFQLVRELRILDERLAYYQGAVSQLGKPLGERRKSDEITLKGMFVDLVQGGAKSAASVYGMARELEFITLPDLFFDAPPFKSVDEMEAYVDRLEFNKKVLEVLKRHLRQFFEWKKRTGEELGTRRKFTLQYLRQHHDIIKMYMAWAKPYLRNVERMSMKDKHSSAPDLISSFEGSMLDIELLASKPFGDFNACVLATFRYRTRPSMKFIQEGYQRGPVHQGEMEMNLRSYVWTAEQIERYKKLKDQEELALMRNISGSVNAAMDSLGGELEKYLEEAGEEASKKEDKKTSSHKKSMMEKMFGDFMPAKETRQKAEKPKKKVLKGNAEAARGMAVGAMFNCYKNFKKAHQMIMW